jgi:hypothetical protein
MQASPRLSTNVTLVAPEVGVDMALAADEEDEVVPDEEEEEEEEPDAVVLVFPPVPRVANPTAWGVLNRKAV